jgi:Tol biopolymer transport system component
VRRWPAAAIVAAALAATAGLPQRSSGASDPVLIARVAPPGVDPNGASAFPSVSANGRFIAFASHASNLGPRDRNGQVPDVYLYDAANRTASLVSKGLGGGGANGPSSTPSISADGTTIAFASRASNLVPHGQHRGNIFVRGESGSIIQITHSFSFGAPNGDSFQPVISANGRFVAFVSTANNLVPGENTRQPNVFLADLFTAQIKPVSVASGGQLGNGPSANPAISGDGRYVSFDSAATNFAPHSSRRLPNVFVHDMRTGRTQRVSVSSNGRAQNAAVPAPFSQISALSADGHYVVFDSNATNLVPGTANGHTQVFRHDMRTGRTILVSRSSQGSVGDNDSFAPSISAGGNVVTFDSYASNLAQPWAPVVNVFVRSVAQGKTLIADVTQDGGPRDPEVDTNFLQRPAIAANGQAVVFASEADNLVPGDHNGLADLFVRLVSWS